MLANYEIMLNDIKKMTGDLIHDLILANENALDGFVNSKVERFDNVRIVLKNVEKTANEIDNKIITAIARFGPEAHDLRELVAYLKITTELVRVSDNTKSYAKNIKSHFQAELSFSQLREYAVPLHKTAVSSLQHAGETFSMDDVDAIRDNYRKVCVEESKTDDLYTILEKNILGVVCKEAEFSTDYIQILSTMRRLERIADRSVTIAKLILFAKNGGTLEIH